MKRSGFAAFGAVLLAIFVGLCIWQTPGLAGARLTQDEIARYLAAIEKVPFPPDEKRDMLARVRTWAEADDGKPVYMLNLMRYHERLRTFPGSLPFEGTPRDANATYEDGAMPLALKTGAYPLFAGEAQGTNVIGSRGGWNRVLVMRYPSRRAFLDLIADPAYAPIAPYKLMALDVDLQPLGSELIVPDVRFVAGAVLLVLFLAVGWARAARRPAPSA